MQHNLDGAVRFGTLVHEPCGCRLMFPTCDGWGIFQNLLGIFIHRI